MSERTCSRCRKSKPLSDFTPDARGVAGRRSDCRACRRHLYAGWRKERSERAAMRSDVTPRRDPAAAWFNPEDES